MTRPSLTHSLRRFGDQDGTAITEFGLIAPIFLLLMLGALDLAHTLYMQGVLQGVVQKAARDSTLESGQEEGTQVAINQKIETQVKRLAANADVTISRRNFYSYTKAAQAVAEPYNDNNGNGICDGGEPFQDNNANGVRDADGGSAGQGGTQAAVVLTVDVQYPRFFPLDKMIGLSGKVHLSAKTVLTNQPYGQKPGEPVPVVRNCP
ncbi:MULTISPECIES: TadE/TadG family type IV pilus assembly protein [Sphingobium]|uniref:Tight adherence protein TadE n=1 Tax=Sphingobium chungbukense TaxID=56193 RepID=A0A0M3AMB5_9SPHN|nr:MULTISPECIES: TadE/TadG family type IV pilus assembly protein [Sphingobium]KKW90081.1 tight adherence protein TadE [Sphingobium chungbukense]PJG49346.1 tight adherence protein TadE [Sphingobium sp. LB126]